MLGDTQSISLHTLRRRWLSHSLVTTFLRLLWIVVVMLGELGVFLTSISACSWPKVNSGNPSLTETHVLLLADTQVQHRALFPSSGGWIEGSRRLMAELYLRKSWNVVLRLRPDAVIFLGDMISNGRAAQDRSQYEKASEKFKSIFSVGSQVDVHYVPGNNDVGLGSVSSVSQKLRSFYTPSFGPTNERFKLANHTFLGLDAPGLVDEDYQRHGKAVSFEDWRPVNGGPVAFVKEVIDSGPDNLVLLTHIPLSRPDSGKCGPQRERGTIRRNAGPGYQSMLGKQTTSYLLQKLKPVIIFSADNRDYCDYKHMLPGDNTEENSIREVTVKSFSPSVHIRRPGFQLLSLVDANQVQKPVHSSFADRLCLLPDQGVVIGSLYGPLMFVTLLVLAYLNVKGARALGRGKLDPLNLSLSPRGSGRSSPNTGQAEPTWSAVPWSPFGPNTRRSPSPRGTLPLNIRTPRTPNGSTNVFVASHPGNSTLSSPVVSSFGGDLESDDEDGMYPLQYAVRRDVYRDEESTPTREESMKSRHAEDGDVVFDAEPGSQTRVQPQFISAPGWKEGRRGWRWSFSFVFRGRRRRITVGVPSWQSFNNLVELFGIQIPSGDNQLLTRDRPRGGSVGRLILTDTVSVLWPALVTFFIINWTVL